MIFFSLSQHSLSWSSLKKSTGVPKAWKIKRTRHMCRKDDIYVTHVIKQLNVHSDL